MSELPCLPVDALHRPRSAAEVFRVFNRLALQGFGGVLAVAQRELVERERWMTPAQFLELLSLGLLLATGWILTEPVRDSVGAMLLVPFTVLMLLKTKISPIWLVAVGAVVGALGLGGGTPG